MKSLKWLLAAISFATIIFLFQQNLLKRKFRGTPANEWNGQIVDSNLPKSLRRNEVKTFFVTIKNTGEKTWYGSNETIVGVRAIDRTYAWMGKTYEMWLKPGEEISKGQTYQFNFSIKAPPYSGQSRFYWRLARIKGKAWQLFGDEINQTIEILE